MKSFTTLATFPTLPAAVAQQSSTVEASSIPVAACRALQLILARPGVKGKRIEGVTLRITCNGPVEKR
jgi:hypothetical protein